MIVGAWTVERLLDLLKHGKECEWLELKTNFGAPDDLGEYVSALSNGAALVGEPFDLRIDSNKVRANERPQKERALLDLLHDRSFEDEVANAGASQQDVLDWLDTSAYFSLSGNPLPCQTEQR